MDGLVWLAPYLAILVLIVGCLFLVLGLIPQIVSEELDLLTLNLCALLPTGEELESRLAEFDQEVLLSQETADQKE